MATLSATQREAVRQAISQIAMGRDPGFDMRVLALTQAEFDSMPSLHGKQGVRDVIAAIDDVLSSTAPNVGGKNTAQAINSAIPAVQQSEMPTAVKLKVIAFIMLARAQFGVF